MKGRQEVIRQSSGICQAFVRQSSGGRQAVVRQSSGSRQAVVRQSPGSRPAVVRQSFGSRQVVVRIFLLVCSAAFSSIVAFICLACGFPTSDASTFSFELFAGTFIV